ncbi:hypothetical protein LCGC14_0738770 [marine sediment metagenome]|uniref:DUF2061 domain-containing protein n=1 Tax=marine sediment metagenome TaxID=412755 RepID=A0A0F9QSG0_9ZZZZ
MDSKGKSIQKAVTWRIVASLLTLLIVFVFTQEIKVSIGVAIAEIMLKFSAYYFHERAWNRFGDR